MSHNCSARCFIILTNPSIRGKYNTSAVLKQLTVPRVRAQPCYSILTFKLIKSPTSAQPSKQCYKSFIRPGPCQEPQLPTKKPHPIILQRNNLSKILSMGLFAAAAIFCSRFDSIDPNEKIQIRALTIIGGNLLLDRDHRLHQSWNQLHFWGVLSCSGRRIHIGTKNRLAENYFRPMCFSIVHIGRNTFIEIICRKYKQNFDKCAQPMCCMVLFGQ